MSFVDLKVCIFFYDLVNILRLSFVRVENHLQREFRPFDRFRSKKVDGNAAESRPIKRPTKAILQ